MAKKPNVNISITADPSDAKRGFKEVDDAANSLGNNSGKWSAKFSTGIGKLTDKFPVVGKSMGKLGIDADDVLNTGLAGSAAAGAVALASFAKSAISAAGDLAETKAKVQQIYGDEAAAIEDFAERAEQSLGQSQQSALDAAATFATFGKSAGLAGEDLTKFSTDFVGLASDLASFNNTSPEEAISAIGSALRGEAEPLRRYGVLLDDATLRNEALKLGLISTTKDALTPQQKVLAAQAAIYKQTTAAQGDFARTSDGMANQQRILKAQIDNLTVAIGEKLLPVATELTHDLVEMVDTISTVAGGFGRFKKAIEDTIPGAKQLGRYLNETLNPFQMVHRASQGLSTAVDGVGSAVKAVGGVFGIGKDEGDEYREVLELTRDASNDLKDSQLDLADAQDSEVSYSIKAVTEELKGQYDAAHALDDMYKGLQDSALSLAEEEIRAREQIATTNGVLADNRKTLDEKKQSIIDVVKEADTLAKKQAEVNREQYSAKESNLVQMQALSELKKGISDPELLGYMDYLIKLLDEASKPRKVELAGPAFEKTSSGLTIKNPDFRAAGGPVGSGSPYIVGEKGPELFVPGGSGNIVPNKALGGNNYSITVNALDPKSAGEAVINAITAWERRNGNGWRS